MREIDDWPTDLVPVPATRECDKCGAWTWWATARQKTKGRCWDCVPGLSLAIVTPEHERRVLRELMATFPDATVQRYTPPRYAPDAYVGLDAGPCLGCHRRVRRYGPDAHPFCLGCQPQREESP